MAEDNNHDLLIRIDERVKTLFTVTNKQCKDITLIKTKVDKLDKTLTAHCQAADAVRTVGWKTIGLIIALATFLSTIITTVVALGL